MMRVLSLLLILFSFEASAGDGRPSSFYGQLGLGGSDLKVESESGSKSSYRGWGYELEVGLELSSSKDFGLNVAGLAQFLDMNNKSSGQTFSETAELQTMGAKGGLFFGPLTVGAGFRKGKLKAQEISLGTGYAKTEAQGDEKFGFVNMTFNIERKYRATAEIQYATGKMGDLDTTQINLFLKFGIVDFFGR